MQLRKDMKKDCGNLRQPQIDTDPGAVAARQSPLQCSGFVQRLHA